jgi:hypothetical protein
MAAFYFDDRQNNLDRDRPLSFHWHAMDLVRLLCLPQARSPAHEMARASILAEAILGWESGQRVSYSRRWAFYSASRRYRGTAFTYSTVTAAVEDLARAGWIIDYTVPPGNLGWQSSFQATDALIDRYHDSVCGLVYTAGEIILLKGQDGELADYRDTRETRRLRKDLARLNEPLARLQIEIPGAEWRGQHLFVGQCCLLPTPANTMRRIFSRGSFRLHGRCYGWWQSIPKTARASMTINGETVAEADYSALHASILYGEANLKFTGDPYDIDGFDRADVKLGFNIAINAKNQRAAVAALADHLGVGRDHAARVIAAIRHRHKPIKRHFCNDAGVRLMRIDSELILSALKGMNAAGDAALPVHDALIVPARCANQAAVKMVESFEQIVGRVNPCQIKIKAGNLPHMGEGARSLPPARAA